MHNYSPIMLSVVLLVIGAATGAQAAGNLASEPTRLVTTIEGQSWTGNEFQLEVGKYYIWEIASDGIDKPSILAPELFRNAWFNQVVIEDREIHSSGSFYGFEYDGPGTISVSFVPARPGTFEFFAPGFENLKGMFNVSGDSLVSDVSRLELNIDTAKLTYSQTEFQLETGKAYRLDVTSDGLEELGVMAPELFRNAWIDDLVIDDLRVKLNGPFSSVEFDDEGTISISFVPIRPGDYPFYSPGYENAGLAGTFIVR